MGDIIQIAGVLDDAEAALLCRCKVTHIGIPLRLAKHAEEITVEGAVEIVRHIEPPTEPVLITYLSSAAEIYHLCNRLHCSIVQLHGPCSVAEMKKLKQYGSGISIIKSLIVSDAQSVALQRLAVDIAPYVDAFITDTYDPETGACGATGKVHDWNVSRAIVQASPRPVILAGGLTPANVRDAIRQVRPAGVDAHTGVEDARGRKDQSSVEAFVREARTGFAEIAGQL